MEESFPISQIISINGEVSQEFQVDGDISNPEYDINTIEDESTHSFDYTGRHDSGNLPDLKNSNPYHKILNSIQEAKKESNRVMTSMMKREMEVSGDVEGAVSKKAREEG